MYTFKVALINVLKKYISENNIFNTLPLNDDDNNPTYPFIVYKVKRIPKTPGYIYIVTIDIWDNKPNTIELERLTDIIAAGINFLSYDDETIVFHAYENLTQDIDTQEENLNRRQIQAEFNAYNQ